MVKPIKHAISIVLRDVNGRTLFALRSAIKKQFPLVWSLPSHFVIDGEDPKATIARIGTDKLGVKLEPVRLLKEGYGEKPDFMLHMHDYEVTMLGEPYLASSDYAELKWAKAEEFLPTLKVKGECTRLYSEYIQESKF